MPGVPKELIEHALKVNPKATQKSNGYGGSHRTSEKPSRKSWQNYSQQGSSRKSIILSGWLTLYSSRRRRPKDPLGLPRIDQVIDSTPGCVLLSFLDCYSGYHQITLKEEDQIKIAFITPYGAYTYKTMSFGLKNAGATYQRAIQLCFSDQLHRNIEAYVDDVVVKTKTQEQFITDLEETFNSLQKFR